MHDFFLLPWAAAGNFFSQSSNPHPPSKVKWFAPYCPLFPNWILRIHILVIHRLGLQLNTIESV